MSIICPLCRAPLARQSKVWICPKGHSFDVAREGYVNLLLAQQKNSREPGDAPEMVNARRDFLQAGHYQALRDAIVKMLAPLHAQSLFDMGCGEGYYTDALREVADEVIGLDIARPAIQLAAKRFRKITWLVGTGAALPLADASVDVVSNLFTQLHIAEIHRVLKTRAHVLVVSPAPDHLWSLRKELFDEVRAHEPEKFLSGFEAQFELREQRTLRVPLHLTQTSLNQLLQMTPYAWKAKLDKRAALEQCETFNTEAAFSPMLLQKR